MVVAKYWRPCQISAEALARLKLASALTDREMRELASEAIIAFCNDLLAQKHIDPKRLK